MNSSETTEFWIGMFIYRTKKYQQETLKRLKAGVSQFESAEENQAKINALIFLLNK